MRPLVAVLVVCVAASACVTTGAGSNKSLGESCTGDAECSSPFNCRAALTGGCAIGKECTMQCSQDQECQSHTMGSHCVQGCNEKICHL
ncbi:MAG TPA: hypothetical protein VIF62_22865 [Labilithrix sp.]|jgi:hypothetical protein